MVFRRFWIITLLIAIFFSCKKGEKQTTSATIFDQLSFQVPEGLNDSILIGTYAVKENRSISDSRMIPLHIAVVPADDRSNLLPPVFFIDGGPGVGVFNWVGFYSEFDTLYRRNHDLVFIDVRGTGKSQPLHCLELQTKSTLNDFLQETYNSDDIITCLKSLTDTVDLSQYNTFNIVDDLDEIRQWLGYEKINLYGLSYGGKVAITYMDRHPESINRVVLHSPSTPNLNNHILRGLYAEKAMTNLFDICEQDPDCAQNFPNIRKEFELFEQQVKNNPPTYANETDTVQLKWGPIARKLYGMLYHDHEYIQLPNIIHEASKGNYTPFINTFKPSPEPSKLFADGMFFSVICAEEINLPFEQTSALNETFLADFLYQMRVTACEQWPVTDISSQFNDDFQSDIPTLIFSGNMDPVTPPSTGQQLASRISNSQHIVIPYMGHMFTDLSNPECYDEYIVAFYDEKEESLSTNCFQHMKPGDFSVMDK